MTDFLKHFGAGSAGRAASIESPIGAKIAQLAAARIDGLLGTSRSRYAAFISYSHPDIACARWLHRAIETYRVPRALVGTLGDFGPVPGRIRPVFRDEDELSGAAELGPKLHAALANSEALIVVCSPAAVRSAWVGSEIQTFKALNPHRAVFGVISRGSPGHAENECFPAQLLLAARPDGTLDSRQTIEPLAPDLQKLDRKVVKLKLIAGLLGIDFAQLYDREQRRRRRFVAAIATFATILIMVLSGLSIVAITYAGIAVKARNAALRSQALAVRERNEAVAARDLAERRLWLAQRAAEEVRFQIDLAEKMRKDRVGR